MTNRTEDDTMITILLLSLCLVRADQLLEKWYEKHQFTKLNRRTLKSDIGIESHEDLPFLQIEDLIQTLEIDYFTAELMVQDARDTANSPGLSDVQWHDKKIVCRFAPEHCSAIFSGFQESPRCSSVQFRNKTIASLSIDNFNFGQKASLQGDFLDAIKYYKNAISYAQSGYDTAHAQLGIIFYHLKQYKDASFHLKRSIQILSNDSDNIERIEKSRLKAEVNHHLSLVNGKLSTKAFLDKHNVNIIVDRETLLQLSLENIVQNEMFQKRNVTSMFMEFGVYYGDSCKIIAKLLEKMWTNYNPPILEAFDSFKGLPEKWSMESSHPIIGNAPIGTFRVQNPKKVINQLMNEHQNLRIHVGLFQNTLQTFLTESGSDHGGGDLVVAFIHIDCDLYSSTKFILDQLKPYLRKGTIIVFDELIGWPGWSTGGEYQALKEFTKESGIEVTFTYSSGQAVSCIIDAL